MGVHRDLRTNDEKIADMLAEDYSFEEIAHRLWLTVGQVRQRYVVICAQMGERPNED
jgi:hypothetical protein